MKNSVSFNIIYYVDENKLLFGKFVKFCEFAENYFNQLHDIPNFIFNQFGNFGSHKKVVCF